jgi:hypothetical protein
VPPIQLENEIRSLNPQPGDIVTVGVPGPIRAEWAEAVGEQLKRAFPDNTIVVMEKGTSLSVGEDHETRLVVGSDQGDVPGYCLRAGQLITATEYDHGKKLLRVYTEDGSARRADLIAAIEKRQDFNTSGGPNWGPANSAKAKNKLLISLLVDLGLMSEGEAHGRFRRRKEEHDRRVSESVERYNDERRALDKAEGKA